MYSQDRLAGRRAVEHLGHDVVELTGLDAFLDDAQGALDQGRIAEGRKRAEVAEQLVVRSGGLRLRGQLIEEGGVAVPRGDGQHPLGERRVE
jgi:hypothetical protein